MTAPLKPERLCFGDTVGLVAPASPPPDPKAIDLAAEALERYGFKPKPAKNVRARHGFLAGADRARAEDLMSMFADKKVKAIVCIRGGYGSSRILDRLDYKIIRRNPKIFAGYSDITALHLALLKKAGLISFHAPMWNGALADPKVPDFTRKSFLRTVMEASPSGSICAGCAGKSVSVLRGGSAAGRLVGGNLSMICASLGTPFAPSFKGKILFLEDVNEQPYRVDRLLTQLWNAGVFSQVAGVIVGDVSKGGPMSPLNPGGEYQQSVADVIKERLSGLRVPVVTALPFGHVDLNATIPVGVRARMIAKKGGAVAAEAPLNGHKPSFRGDSGGLIITESAVR